MFNSTITVSSLSALIMNATQVDIYFKGIGKTYRFDNDDIPEEITYCTVDSIDDPFNASSGSPLCMNINEDEMLDDVQAFEEEFKDYEV